MVTDTLLQLHDRLREDERRQSVPFAEDLAQYSELILKPYVAEHEVIEALNQWCAKRQPCQFGRVAARNNQIYFCLINERDLADGDHAIREKIVGKIKHWKQRAVHNTECPPHSFVLVCATRRLQLAAPDDNLRRFSNRILELTGWKPERRARRGENTVSSDYLHIKNPKSNAYHGFRFNIDYFAAAGDGKWWHDHRFPAGIAFTANAAGHMKAYMDWYDDPSREHGAWALTQAMMTIAKAHPTRGIKVGAPLTEQTAREEGRVTWLIELKNGKPIVDRLPCPLNPVPKQFDNKDWTKYEGLLHTDHAVRDEFFDGRDEPITVHNNPLLDFTYLYDEAQTDHAEFMTGRITSQEELYSEIGPPETWSYRDGTEVRMARSNEQANEIQDLLKACCDWQEL